MPMTPEEVEERLSELGSPIVSQDFGKVEDLHLAREMVPSQFKSMVLQLLPGTVTLDAKAMTRDDLGVLMRFPCLTSVCAHSLSFAADVLQAIHSYARLRSVAMSYTSLLDDDVRCLAGSRHLRTVHFAATELTDDAMAVFKTLPNLELLDLRGTKVSDAGLQDLTELRNLFTIDVRETAVTKLGADVFRRDVSGFLPDVEVLVGGPEWRRTSGST